VDQEQQDERRGDGRSFDGERRGRNDGPYRARKNHRIHQQAERPDAARDGNEDLQAPVLLGDQLLGQPEGGAAASRRDERRQARSHHLHVMTSGPGVSLRRFRSDRLSRIDSFD